MNALLLWIAGAGALLMAARGLDVALWTDLSTGLCTAGSVWWRYLALGAAVLLSLALGRCAAGTKPERLCRRLPAAGALSLAAAVCFGAGGVLRLLVGLSGPAALARAALELVCAVWMVGLGRNWLRKGRWQPPARHMAFPVAGTVVFYWCILSWFMLNGSSCHRVIPTAEGWQLLAALLFLSALARALCLPGTQPVWALIASALAAFYLDLCWGLPQAAAQAAAGQLALPELAFQLGLCCTGALGGVCAAACLSRTGAKHAR